LHRDYRAVTSTVRHDLTQGKKRAKNMPKRRNVCRMDGGLGWSGGGNAPFELGYPSACIKALERVVEIAWNAM
jgi:hypothetical protein